MDDAGKSGKGSPVRDGVSNLSPGIYGVHPLPPG
jgi:hypothetical protein